MQKLKWVCSFESLQVCVDVYTMYVYGVHHNVNG